MKALEGNRFVVRQRRETGHMPTEAGGRLLSVDLSQAFDRVNRIKLDEALQAHQVGADIRSTVAATHEEAALGVAFSRHPKPPRKVSAKVVAWRRPYGPYSRRKSCGT